MFFYQRVRVEGYVSVEMCLDTADGAWENREIVSDRDDLQESVVDVVQVNYTERDAPKIAF